MGQQAVDHATGIAEMRRAVGRFALGASTVTEPERRAVIESRLPSHTWPARTLKIVAVDAETGPAGIRQCVGREPGGRRRGELRRAGRVAARHDRRAPVC